MYETLANLNGPILWALCLVATAVLFLLYVQGVMTELDSWLPTCIRGGRQRRKALFAAYTWPVWFHVGLFFNTPGWLRQLLRENVWTQSSPEPAPQNYEEHLIRQIRADREVIARTDFDDPWPEPSEFDRAAMATTRNYFASLSPQARRLMAAELLILAPPDDRDRAATLIREFSTLPVNLQLFVRNGIGVGRHHHAAMLPRTEMPDTILVLSSPDANTTRPSRQVIHG